MAEEKKKGFFSKLFSRSKEEVQPNIVIPTKTELNKMKKAELLDFGGRLDLELSESLTKVKIIEAILNHGADDNDTQSDKNETSKEETRAEEAAPAEEAPIEETSAEEAPIEEEAPAEEAAPAEEEAPAEEAPIEEEATAEEAAPAEEAPIEEEATAEEAAPAEEAPIEEEATAEEAAPAEEVPAEETESTSLDEQEINEDDTKEAKIVPKQHELSPSQIIEEFEKSQLKDDLPIFRPGDTVTVSVKVKEGERSRLQAFEGVVMHIKNAGLNSSFIVRKISSGIGVERTFQMHSPLIDSIAVKRKGDVRKAKLYYLRERSGRSARIKERLE